MVGQLSRLTNNDFTDYLFQAKRGISEFALALPRNRSTPSNVIYMCIGFMKRYSSGKARLATTLTV